MEGSMSINLFKDKGISLEKQRFTWKDLVQKPISKLDDDAFTRIRVILMNGIELEAFRFSHSCARMNRDWQLPLAKIRRVDQHQATMINWLLGSDHSPLETTIGHEQVAIEVTAAVAQKEPDKYLAQVYRYGLLEDFDHMYRYSALLDRLEGKDANNILQNYTDIIPGRPTYMEHRDPEDELRKCYNKNQADAITKFHALTIMSGEQQTHNYYMNIGPMFADPTARQLYAEIASIEEQHVTQYESIIDPTETWLEKWLIHEANEVYNYYSCVAYETNPRIKAIWERFLDYELGQLQYVMGIFKQFEKRDPAEVLPQKLPDPVEYQSQREFVRGVLETEVDLRAVGQEFLKGEESEISVAYREQMNSEGSPSETVTAGYVWRPGTELSMNETILQQ
jgi:flavodoxin